MKEESTQGLRRPRAAWLIARAEASLRWSIFSPRDVLARNPTSSAYWQSFSPFKGQLPPENEIRKPRRLSTFSASKWWVLNYAPTCSVQVPEDMM